MTLVEKCLEARALAVQEHGADIAKSLLWLASMSFRAKLLEEAIIVPQKDPSEELKQERKQNQPGYRGTPLKIAGIYTRYLPIRPGSCVLWRSDTSQIVRTIKFDPPAGYTS